MRNLRNSKGFTLIELMIVVVIIGILAAIAIPKFTDVTNNAKQAEAEPILKQMCTLAGVYAAENGAYAANNAELTSAGWQDPSGSAQHFTAFTMNADSTAAATAGTTGAVNATIDCSTGDITP